MKNFSDSVKYIGADDKDLDLFESQYIVPNGVSYNSYVILDDKIAVMDTIDERKTDEWFANLEKELGGKTPDYLVISHLEPDHSANIKNLLKSIRQPHLWAQQRLLQCFRSSLILTLLLKRLLLKRATAFLSAAMSLHL